MAKEMQGATFCISEAMWAAGDFRKHVVDAPQKERALVTVKVRRDNVAGVKLPVFTLCKGTGTTVEMETLGLASGGRQIGAAKEKFTSLIELLVKLGSLQTSFLTLDEAIKVTNRRVNALDNVRECLTHPSARALVFPFLLTNPFPIHPPFNHKHVAASFRTLPLQVVIPSFVATIAYVTSELDEIEKEEFFRLKKVLKVKIRNAEIEKEEEEKALALLGDQVVAEGSGGGAGAVPEVASTPFD